MLIRKAYKFRLEPTAEQAARLAVLCGHARTSQTCPCCGHVSKDNRKTQAHFECVECRYTNNADIVGALNILERGHRLLACGESALAT